MRKPSNFLPLLTLYAALLSSPAGAQIVLSEIMFNPAGSEYDEEFIEVYNTSASIWIDLSGYRLGDQTEQDSLIDAGMGMIIPPSEYALVLDPGYWGNSTAYDSLIPQNALTLTINDNAFGSSGLNNSSPDTVVLKNSLGQVIASFAYSTGNPDGYSEEKIRLEAGDDLYNWANSLAYLGTPGFANSVQPPDFDLALTQLSANPSPLPYQAPLTVTVLLKNLGLNPISGGSVLIALSGLQDTVPDTLLATPDFNGIDPADSIEVEVSSGSLPPGSHVIFAWHSLSDNRPENDTLQVILPGGYPEGSLIINEIYPKTGGAGCEWVELFNPSNLTVDLYTFSLSDADTSDRTILTDESRPVDPGDFALLAQDSRVYALELPGGLQLIVLENGWPVLNDDGDTPTLFDPAGAVQDAVPYTGWDIPTSISLERISPFMPSADHNNWQPSFSPTGGTPGQVNSTAPQDPGEGTASLHFNPDPFDPDFPGQLTVTVSLPPEASSAAVVVFDLRGRKLKVIGDGISGQSTLLWDGRDAEGRRLSPGLYVIFAEFRDSGGNRKQIIKKTLVIAGRL